MASCVKLQKNTIGVEFLMIALVSLFLLLSEFKKIIGKIEAFKRPNNVIKRILIEYDVSLVSDEKVDNLGDWLCAIRAQSPSSM